MRKLPQLSLRDLFWLVALVAMGCGWWSYRQFLLAQRPHRLSVSFPMSDRKLELAVLPDRLFRARVTTERGPGEDDEGKATTRISYCEISGVVKPKAADGKYSVHLEAMEWWGDSSNQRMSTTLKMVPGQPDSFGSAHSYIDVLLEENWD